MDNLRNLVMWLGLTTTMLSMGMVLQNSHTSNVKGTLTVASNKVQLQHVYAMGQPGFFDKTNEDIVVIVTSIPISDKAVEDRWERSAMVNEQALKSVEITINSKRQPISVSVRHPAFKASPSGFSSNYILELKTFDEKNVEGRMYCKTEQEFFNTIYTFDFKFKAEIRRKQELPPPTEEEKEAATKSPQATVYLDFVKALNGGDVKTLKKVLATDVARGLDGPEREEMLEFMQIGNPPKAEFQRIIVKGDSATLMLSAQDEGYELKGTIEFIKEGDHWKVMRSNWEEE